MSDLYDLDKIEEAAKAATPGEWFSTATRHDGWIVANPIGDMGDYHGIACEFDEENAHYVARARPSAILALISDHRAALAEVEENRKLVEQCRRLVENGNEWRDYAKAIEADASGAVGKENLRLREDNSRLRAELSAAETKLAGAKIAANGLRSLLAEAGKAVTVLASDRKAANDGRGTAHYGDLSTRIEKEIGNG